MPPVGLALRRGNLPGEQPGYEALVASEEGAIAPRTDTNSPRSFLSSHSVRTPVGSPPSTTSRMVAGYAPVGARAPPGAASVERWGVPAGGADGGEPTGVRQRFWPKKGGVRRARGWSVPSSNQASVQDTSVEVHELVNRFISNFIIYVELVAIDRLRIGIDEEASEMKKDRRPSRVRITPYIQHLVQRKVRPVLLGLEVDDEA